MFVGDVYSKVQGLAFLPVLLGLLLGALPILLAMILYRRLVRSA